MKQTLTSVLIALCAAASTFSQQKPNLIIIYADDLGYGDVQCYNPEGKIPTPHIDALDD